MVIRFTESYYKPKKRHFWIPKQHKLATNPIKNYVNVHVQTISTLNLITTFFILIIKSVTVKFWVCAVTSTINFHI